MAGVFQSRARGSWTRELAVRGHPVEDAPGLTVRWLWRRRRAVGFLHFHWRPDLYYALIRREGPPPRFQGPRSWLRLPGFALAAGAARRLGYRVVWTIHEVYPPEHARRPPGAVSRRLDRVAARLLARSSHLLLAHEEPVARRARRELGLGDRGIEVVPHSSYDGVYAARRSREEARADLGLPPGAFAFLCFGQIRRDKALDLVLEAFAGLEDPHIALLVAGRVEDERAEALLSAAAARDPRVVLRVGRSPTPRSPSCTPPRTPRCSPAARSGPLARPSSPSRWGCRWWLPRRGPPRAARRGGGRRLFAPGDTGALRTALQAAAAEPQGARARGIAARQRAARLPSWAEAAERVAALMAQLPRRG